MLNYLWVALFHFIVSNTSSYSDAFASTCPSAKMGGGIWAFKAAMILTEQILICPVICNSM